MISRLARTVLKSNSQLPLFNTMPGMLKLAYCFSDDDPFNKFKRRVNKNKRNEKSSLQHKDSDGEKAATDSSRHQSERDSKHKHEAKVSNEQEKSSTHTPLGPGFSKFKRRSQNPESEDLKLQKKEMKSEFTSSSKQQVNEEQRNSEQSTKNKEQFKNQFQSEQRQTNKSERRQIKGFSKFQSSKKKGTKDQASRATGAQAKSQEQSQKNEEKKENDERAQNLMSQKVSEEAQGISKEQINKRTEEKKQQYKEDWERFYQEQVKKTKQDINETAFNKKFKKIQKMPFLRPGMPQVPRDSNSLMKYVMLAGGSLLLLSYLYDLIFDEYYRTIESGELTDLLKQGQITQTWFLKNVSRIGEENQKTTSKYVYVKLKSGEILKCESNNDFQVEWNKLVDSYNVNMEAFGGSMVLKKPTTIESDEHILKRIRSGLSFVLLFVFIRSLTRNASGMSGKQGRGGGMASAFGDSKSQRFRQPVNTRFNDVVGMNKAKEEIVEFIDFLQKPEKYSKLGAKIPRGALLTGPPGTGKTMIAKACAGESGVPFFTISGSQFVEMYVGVGAQRVRSLFKEAKQASPSIIFIDQIDAVGKKRSSGSGGGGNDERDNTLNQLLVQMDGFDKSSNVIVFAATNQKSVLDPALTRPGRFDRLIEVDLPDIEGRKEIFHVHLKPLTLDSKYSVEDYARRLATLTPGFSGADIKNLCNEAAIIAARAEKESVSMIDFEMASERIIGGVEKKSSLITPETKRTVAYHECGHGVVSWFMEHASPLLKLTIIPRSKGALGYAQYLPNENQMYTLKQLEDQICVILGGRISEEIFFNKISTGASDDLQKAQKVCKSIIAEHGMGSDLGWLSFRETQYAKEYSKETEERIDKEMRKIIQRCSIRTRKIINEKKEMIQELAEVLLKEETIDQRTIQKVLGERPFKSSKQYEDYIREKRQIDEQEEKGQQPETPSTVALSGSTMRLQEAVVTKVKIIQEEA